MRTKGKIARASTSEKKKGKRSVYTVNVARMDRFLQESQNSLKNRSKAFAERSDELAGKAIAKPAANDYASSRQRLGGGLVSLAPLKNLVIEQYKGYPELSEGALVLLRKSPRNVGTKSYKSGYEVLTQSQADMDGYSSLAHDVVVTVNGRQQPGRRSEVYRILKGKLISTELVNSDERLYKSYQMRTGKVVSGALAGPLAKRRSAKV